jgi:hypothetical protein
MKDRRDARPTGRGYMKTPIAVSHGGDVEAIQFEIEHSTIAQMMERHGVCASAVFAWQFGFNMRASRVCRICKVQKTAKDMVRGKGGAVLSLCTDCDTPALAAKRDSVRKSQAKKAASVDAKVDDDAPPQVALVSARQKIGFIPPSFHWNKWTAQAMEEAL